MILMTNFFTINHNYSTKHFGNERQIKSNLQPSSKILSAQTILKFHCNKIFG